MLAAANPKFGRFDPYQPIAQQIDLPPTLINRFDIIFTLRDIPDKERDKKIAAHVLNEHTKSTTTETAIPTAIMRKYIAYARQRVRPGLDPEAVKEIEKFYVELRNQPVAAEGAMRPIPISARQLEALIRMSEASAKVRLSNVATIEDAKRAIDLMKYYLMQVGYDYESKTFDIDRVGSKFTSSQRNKIMTVREAIIALSTKIGKEIPIEEVRKELEDKMEPHEIDDAITKLIDNQEFYRPKRDYIGVF